MRRHYQIFIIAALAASLLDPTFAGIVVQPGYNEPSKTADGSSTDPKQDESSSQNQQPQNSYVGSSQPAWDNGYRERWRQQQMYQQQLQRQRQQYLEQYQRYQQQQQLYRQAQMQQYMLGQAQHQEPVVGSPQKQGDKEVVGSTMIMPTLHPYASGKTWGGKTFALGPLGLYSHSLGGHGGLGGVGGLGGAGRGMPLLLAPNPQSEQTASDQAPNPIEETATSRGGRKARDIGVSEGQRFRHKSAIHERNGLASDSAIASGKQTRNAPSLEKMKVDDAVGEPSKKATDETVGTPLNLDPLGLAKKAEDLIGGLSFLPPPSHHSHHSFPSNNNQWSRDGQSSSYDDFDDRYVGNARDQDVKLNAPSSQNQNVARHRGDVIDDRRGLYYPQPPPRGYGSSVHQYGMYPSYGSPSTYRPGWVRSPISMDTSGSPYAKNSLATGTTGQLAQLNSVTPQLTGLSSANRQDPAQLWGYGTDPGSFSPFGTVERADIPPMIHEAPLGMRLTDGTSFYRVISAPTSVDNWSQQISDFESAGTPAALNPGTTSQGQEVHRVTESIDSSFANWPAQMMGLQPMSGGPSPFGTGIEAQSMIWAKSAQPPTNDYGSYQPNPMLGRPSPDLLVNQNRGTTYIRDEFGMIPTHHHEGFGMIPTHHRDIYDDRTMYNSGYGGTRPIRVHEHHESQIF